MQLSRLAFFVKSQSTIVNDDFTKLHNAENGIFRTPVKIISLILIVILL